MHVRRSVLTFILGGTALFSLILTFKIWYQSSYASVFPWPSESEQGHEVDAGPGGIVDGNPNGDSHWPDPVPGEDDLRKHPAPPKEDDDALPPNPGAGQIHITSSLLRSRLQALLDAPVRSHAAASTENEKGCPRKFADKQVNPDQFRDNLEKWVSISESDIRKRRGLLVAYLEKLDKSGTAIMGGADRGEGRGVVITAGNKDTAHTALVTLRMLRLEYKSELPVQIFSFPGEITDQVILNEIADLGASHHELTGLHKDTGAWKNFHLKAQSIISSKFAEVLYLDSDNIPLRDPAFLFEEEIYKSSGAVFWPDFNKDHPDNAVWRVLGKTCDYSEWTVESGQILIDKRGNNGLNLAALHVAAHMQAEYGFWFTLSGGDKDTFRYAFWALGAQYATAPRWLSSLGTSYDRDAAWKQGKFCGFVMLQYNIVKNERGIYMPLFVHANLLKHRNGDIPKSGKYFQTVKHASHDEAKDRTLDRVHAWVYQDGGMCVDMELTGIDEGAGEQEVITESFAELYEGLFKDFEDQFFRQKGKVGGW